MFYLCNVFLCPKGLLATCLVRYNNIPYHINTKFNCTDNQISWQKNPHQPRFAGSQSSSLTLCGLLRVLAMRSTKSAVKVSATSLAFRLVSTVQTGMFLLNTGWKRDVELLSRFVNPRALMQRTLIVTTSDCPVIERELSNIMCKYTHGYPEPCTR